MVRLAAEGNKWRILGSTEESGMPSNRELIMRENSQLIKSGKYRWYTSVRANLKPNHLITVIVR